MEVPGGTLTLSGSDYYGGGTYVEQGTLMANRQRGDRKCTTNLYVGSVPNPLFGGVVPAQADAARHAGAGHAGGMSPLPFAVRPFINACAHGRSNSSVHIHSGPDFIGCRGRLSQAWICRGSRFFSCAAVGSSQELIRIPRSVEKGSLFLGTFFNPSSDVALEQSGKEVSPPVAKCRSEVRSNQRFSERPPMS